MRLTLTEAETLARAALVATGTHADAARITACALVRAEADGQAGHGLNRVPFYAAQVRSGKVAGQAHPLVTEIAPGLVRVDAGLGFAYPALEAAIKALSERVPCQGMAAAAISHSHHFGRAGAHVEALAERGFVALLFGNSPKAIPFWGGRHARMGTNPIAFAAPCPSGPPLVIDLALSRVARGKVMAAAKVGTPIPEDWALDEDGQPTTDPERALRGAMMPIGEAKGAALALMVEVLAAALTGGRFGFEAGSFFTSAGVPPDLGHLLVCIDPDRISGGAFAERMATLVAAVADEPGARLPGSSRLERRRRAESEGIEISDELHSELLELASA